MERARCGVAFHQGIPPTVLFVFSDKMTTCGLDKSVGFVKMQADWCGGSAFHDMEVRACSSLGQIPFKFKFKVCSGEADNRASTVNPKELTSQNMNQRHDDIQYARVNSTTTNLP